MTEQESRNYTHVLLENLQAEIRDLRNDMKNGFAADIAQDQQMEDRVVARQNDQESRLKLLEKMNWTALGGLLIVGALVTIYGQKLLHLLA